MNAPEESLGFFRVLNDAEQPQSERMTLTQSQLEDLRAQLPEGWTIEEIG